MVAATSLLAACRRQIARCVAAGAWGQKVPASVTRATISLIGGPECTRTDLAMARLKVRGSSAEIDAPTGATLFSSLQAAGYPISTSCGGRAVCGLCRIVVLSGRELLSPIDAKEIVHLGNVAKVIGARLACQARVLADGDIEIDVPEVVDHAERKRSQQLRRASSPRPKLGRPSEAGGARADATRRLSTPSTPPQERVEWRPRILERTGSGGPEGTKS
jgi:2Fe-2S ferredoxin